MANISKTNSMMEFPLQIKRQYAAPIDTTSIFYDFESAQEYATSGATAYVGQQIVVVNETEGTATAYIISNTAGVLESIGSTTLGDDKSIALANGVLSLKNFGVQYYAYDSEAGKYSEAPTSGFKDGLEPRVREVSTGIYEIAWYEPNPNTVEGLASSITTLQNQVSTLNNNVTAMYTNEQIDAAIRDAVSDVPQWGTIPV